MVSVNRWSQSTGRLERFVSMGDRTAYSRRHAERLTEWLAAEDSSSDHVYYIDRTGDVYDDPH